MMKLSDYVDINPKTQLPKGVQVPFVGMDAITAGRRKVTANERREAKGSGAKFLPGDTLFARITPCLENGKIAQFSDKDAGLGSTEFFVLRAKPNVSNQDFVFYFALQKELRDAAEKSMTGASGRQRADASALKEFECEFPSLPIQRHIAGILSAYDELIENNQRRIRILEEMARSLYREWFVHFRYPGHKSVPLVDSPLGQIPQGWEVRVVEDVLKRVPSGKKYDQKSASPMGTVPILDQGKSGIIGYHDDEPGVYATEDSPIIVFANHTCYQRLILFPFSAIQNVLPFVPNPLLKRDIYWLHWATNGLIVFNDYKGHWPEFIAKELVVPPAEICQSFGSFTSPVMREILKLERAIEKLRRTRDLLLPRLLTGQIFLVKST